MLSEAIAKSFEGYVEFNLVTELEAVGDGLGCRVYLHRYAFQFMHLPAFGERFAAEADDAEADRVRLWGPAPSGQSEPDFGWELGGETMKDERRQQADRSVRRTLGNFNERVVLGDRRVGQAIEASSGTHEHTASEEA